MAWAGEARGAVGEAEGGWCVEGPALLEWHCHEQTRPQRVLPVYPWSSPCLHQRRRVENQLSKLKHEHQFKQALVKHFYELTKKQKKHK